MYLLFPIPPLDKEVTWGDYIIFYESRYWYQILRCLGWHEKGRLIVCMNNYVKI